MKARSEESNSSIPILTQRFSSVQTYGGTIVVVSENDGDRRSVEDCVLCMFA